MTSLHICLETQKSDGTTSLIPNNISSPHCLVSGVYNVIGCSSRDGREHPHHHSLHTSTESNRQTGCYCDVAYAFDGASVFIEKDTPKLSKYLLDLISNGINIRLKWLSILLWLAHTTQFTYPLRAHTNTFCTHFQRLRVEISAVILDCARSCFCANIESLEWRKLN